MFSLVLASAAVGNQSVANMTSLRAIDGDTSYHSRESFSFNSKKWPSDSSKGSVTPTLWPFHSVMLLDVLPNYIFSKGGQSASISVYDFPEFGTGA